jgi:eukaryotic-like serine/threonine-protein kinase
MQSVTSSASPASRILGLVRHTFGDRYQIDREIGRGCESRVFLALDRQGQKLALKILHPEFIEGMAASRFLREIRLMSQLSHPNIARLLDSGERDWLVYLAMAFIDGPTLHEVLGRQGRLSFADASRVACDLLEALAHAHQLGIVHRDVKPGNVIICPDRGAVLLDFGIARAIIASSTHEQITHTGMTVGSSAYMSPEQINGDQDVDGRSDLYSLGCVLFECLVGRPPFVRRKEAVVLQLHLTEPAPDVRIFRPEVPVYLAELVNKALAKQPMERWQTAAEMQTSLQTVS